MNDLGEGFSSEQSASSSTPNPYDIRIVSRRDFLLTGLVASAGIYLGAGEAIAKSAPGRTPAGRSSAPAQGMTEQDREYMRLAIRQMRQAGVVDKTGGPFGAVIVCDGKVLAVAGNSVVRDHDPSAHAEVNAIREACRRLGTIDLSGSVLYSSCECCPMCYATAYWARISKIYYAAAWTDFDDLFDDANISQDMAKPYPERALAPQQILQGDAQKVWREFRKIPDGVRY
ncbi:MAG: nucleoside deaminase [Nitrospirae bacterium]|nr:MAG: nucleoside deaminase [Nitrospirota bacterium]